MTIPKNVQRVHQKILASLALSNSHWIPLDLVEEILYKQHLVKPILCERDNKQAVGVTWNGEVFTILHVDENVQPPNHLFGYKFQTINGDTVHFDEDGLVHREDDLPARIIHDHSGQWRTVYWFTHGKRIRKDNPSKPDTVYSGGHCSWNRFVANRDLPCIVRNCGRVMVATR